MVRAVPEVVHPPHAKPTIMAMTAPTIRPQMPYFTFAAVHRYVPFPVSLRCFVDDQKITD
jgi:hypothetical protein